MPTEKELDAIEQDTDVDPAESEESDGDDTQPDDTDYKALYETEKTERKTAEKRYADLRTDYDDKAHKVKKSKSPEPTPDQDEVTDWKIMHAEDIRLTGQEFQEEVTFYKSHGVAVTPEVLEKALADAKRKKGLGKSGDDDADRQADTASPAQGESRKAKAKPKISPRLEKWNITPEQKAEIDAEMSEEQEALGAI